MRMNEGEPVRRSAVREESRHHHSHEADEAARLLETRIFAKPRIEIANGKVKRI